jgi:hypothetical protein
VRVDANSPKWLQRIVYQCAVGLQRDEGYDFPQWGEDGPSDGVWATMRDLHALVLVENGSIAVGAVAFLRTDWPYCEPGWLMMFAWTAAIVTGLVSRLESNRASGTSTLNSMVTAHSILSSRRTSNAATSTRVSGQWSQPDLQTLATVAIAGRIKRQICRLVRSPSCRLQPR